MGEQSHYLSEHSEYLANIILVRQRTELYVHYINESLIMIDTLTFTV